VGSTLAVVALMEVGWARQGYAHEAADIAAGALRYRCPLLTRR
jgi:hypothetical protein